MRPPQFDVDVVVAGGGPAGCTTAAALAELGHSVLLVDAGTDRHRQLAGELLHPPGVEDLHALGLGEGLSKMEAQTIVGFALIEGPTRESRTALLPYPGGSQGLALEHASLTLPLLAAVSKRPKITVRPQTRITEVLRNDSERITVSVSKDDHAEQVSARLLVAADGRASHVRKLLGIGEQHERLSTMLGVTVDSSVLPFTHHGHIFIGGPAPVLGYAISTNTARIMVDLPLGSRASHLREDPTLLAGIPSPLREALDDAVLRQTPRMASNDTRLPHTVVKGRAVLVGDAAGCCHPLSASGMASSTRDGRALAVALGVHGQNIEKALQLYASLRRPAQRTRIALASALYRAFTGRGADMQALRSGLFHYWQATRTGAAVSMTLLSTRETRMWVMAREYLRVVACGMSELAREAFQRDGRSLQTLLRAGSGLLGSSWPHLKGASGGAVEDLTRLIRHRHYTLPKGESAERKRAPASRT